MKMGNVRFQFISLSIRSPLCPIGAERWGALRCQGDRRLISNTVFRGLSIPHVTPALSFARSRAARFADGVQEHRNDEPTGALPGRLVRGGRQASAALR